MEPKAELIKYLQTYKNATVDLSELEELFSGRSCGYEPFAQAVLELEAAGILDMVLSKGRTGKELSLAYRYKIARSRLRQDLHQDIHRARLALHLAIRLDAYYSLDSVVWERDFPYLKKISAYLNMHALPETAVPAPERSFELVGDEKWIAEGSGKEVLERAGLWEKLLIVPVADPLMMAVNPRCMAGDVHLHLIVENKTTYQALLQALPDTSFTTLIYGCGKKIMKSIELLPMQLPLSSSCAHRFYYFGDLDKEGVNIWYGLDSKVRERFGSTAAPAVPFYEACLMKKSACGKEKQRGDEQALEHFLRYFTPRRQEQIRQCLAAGGYYPQETLRTQELQELWRSVSWNY